MDQINKESAFSSCCLKKMYIIFVTKNYENKSRYSQWCELEACKSLVRNSLYCGLEKMIESDIGCRFEKYILGSTCLFYFCSPNYKLFEHDFLLVFEKNSWLHPSIFIFFETDKGNFEFFKTTRSLVLGSQKNCCQINNLDTRVGLVNRNGGSIKVVQRHFSYLNSYKFSRTFCILLWWKFPSTQISWCRLLCFRVVSQTSMMLIFEGLQLHRSQSAWHSKSFVLVYTLRVFTFTYYGGQRDLYGWFNTRQPET
jgi:hypothetical protein